MKKSLGLFLFVFASMLMVVAGGCKKTIMDSPGYAPSGHYFSVSGQRLEALKAKRLKVLKLDADGLVLKEHMLTGVVEVSGKLHFRHKVLQPLITGKPSANSKHYTVTD